MYTATQDGRIVRANAALARLLGYETGDALWTVTTAQFYQHPADSHAWIAAGPCDGTLTTADVAWRTRDSRPLTVRLTGRLIAPASSDGAWIDVCVEDVTDARRLEAEMR